MITDLTNKIDLTIVNKYYWIPYLMITGVLSGISILLIYPVPLFEDNIYFAIIGAILIGLIMLINVFHFYLLSAHEIIGNLIIETKKQEDRIYTLEVQLRNKSE